MIKGAKSLRRSNPSQTEPRAHFAAPPQNRHSSTYEPLVHQQRSSVAESSHQPSRYSGSSQGDHSLLMDSTQDQTGRHAPGLPHSAGLPLHQPAATSAGYHDGVASRAATWPAGDAEFKPSFHPTATQQRLEDLRIYRELVGITSPKELSDPHARQTVRSYLWLKRPSKNVGYYQNILNEELRASVWYHTSSWITNALLIIQIAVAATLTALGASHDKNRGLSITILGAINVAVATGLAYVKAQGLPMRAMVYRNDLRRLKEQIDFTERQFMLGVETGTTLDPEKAAASLRDQFDKVQINQEKQEADAEVGTMSSHPAQGKGGNPVYTKSGSKSGATTTATTMAMPTTPVAEKPHTGGDAAWHA